MSRRPSRNRLLVIAVLAVAVLLAGCALSAPDSDSTMETLDNQSADQPAGTGPNSTAEEPSGGDEPVGATTGPINNTGLPVDENRIYNQTQELLDSDAPAPTVEVSELDVGVGDRADSFFDCLGLTNQTDGSAGGEAAAIARGANTVVVNEELAADGARTEDYTLELVLAHEFAHTIQFEEGYHVVDWGETPVDWAKTDTALLHQALIEGGAVFAAERYAEATGMNASQAGRFERQYQQRPADQTFAYAPYYHGSQYFEAVLDSGDELGTVYTENPPRTTAGLLEPERADEEPAPVEFDAEANREGWEYRGPADRYGAMLIHVALSAHIDLGTADEAAAGWANDRLLPFENGEAQSFAWVTHWNSAEDADQFAQAFEETLSARDDGQTESVDLRRAGDQSVVVLAGEESFRESVVIDGTDANLDVVLPEASDARARPRAGAGATQSQHVDASDAEAAPAGCDLLDRTATDWAAGLEAVQFEGIEISAATFRPDEDGRAASTAGVTNLQHAAPGREGDRLRTVEYT